MTKSTSSIGQSTMLMQHSRILTLLNAPVLTSYGGFRLEPMSPEYARALLHSEPWQSAIGHASTAAAVSAALGISVPMQRIEYRQATGERALVFWLRARLPEGVVIEREEIGRIGYDWALLTRLR